MDDDLRQKLAPRRNKRYAHLRGFNEEAAWARTLQWQTNGYDFYRLRGSIVDHLDSEFRENVGVRVDQLATTEEIEKMLRTCRALYEEDAVFQHHGIYVFLHTTMRLWLGGKVCRVLDSRRQRGGLVAA